MALPTARVDATPNEHFQVVDADLATSGAALARERRYISDGRSKEPDLRDIAERWVETAS